MNNLFNKLQKPFVILLTLPSAIVLVLGCLPYLTVRIDNNLADGVLSPFVFQFTPSAAQAILTVTSTSAMAALSLAYSLALLVFTLAAGNIGPRLLKRFTSELTTQLTAGVLGGTFLYSLHALLYVQKDFLPKTTIAGAGVLATLSVLQLIYFVRQVAKNITIDEEIASISNQLIKDLDERDRADSDSDKHLEDYETVFDICTNKSGYINNFDVETLLKIAVEHDIFLKTSLAEGSYILKEQSIAQADRKLDEEVVDKIRNAIEIESSRSANNRIEFSTQLLVEIALRALSPGVNDTYTAIAVIDALSNALAIIIDDEGDYIFKRDEENNIRLGLYHHGAKALLGTTFHPLRRASTSNILMAQALAKALLRLYEISPDKRKDMIHKHAKLLLAELENGNHLKEDTDSVYEYLSRIVD